MTSNRSRRAVLAGALLASVAGLSVSSARDLLEDFAPLSGRAWDAAGRELSESVDSPYGDATVRIDDEGVPHVEADDERAAYFAVGYVQAFDRLFQLDLQRRAMRGRLSEVVGDATLDSDEFHVAMDFVGAAQATWNALEGSAAGRVVEAYADGVTAAIEREQLPLEFELLGYEPRPWTPVDTTLMEKQISWTLTGSFRELRRALVADRLGEEVADAAYPGRMDHDVPILRDSSGSRSTRSDRSGPTAPPAIGRELTDWLSGFESSPGIGSNSWVVSGEYTETGLPVMANDPHLRLTAPPVWYEQHVETPETSVRGVTFPGVPFVVIGANAHGAWGFTNVGADVLDCYRYEIDDESEQYRYRGEWREFDVEEREIAVANGDDRSQTVRKTVHGPVLERHEQTVGVSWTGHTATRTTEAIYEYASSDGIEDVLEATRRFDLPTQNLTYADTDGRTLYYVTGKLPIRTIDGDLVAGDRLFDGSAGEGEWDGFTPFGESSWDGFVPFDEKPHAIDPDYVATGNQRVVDDPDHYIGTAYATPYRGARIYDRLDGRAESGDPMDLEFHRELQGDTFDVRASQFIPELYEAVAERTEGLEGADWFEEEEDERPDVEPDLGPLANAASALATWSRQMDRESDGALLFARWLAQYRRLVFEPVFEEGDLDESYYPNDWTLATLPDDSTFFDDRSRPAVMVDALREAIAELEDEGWETYGDWNTTRTIEHPFGGEAPFLSYEELRADGSSATVHNYRVESAVGSSWRMIVEPGGDTLGILPGGNSGDYFSDHYDDQFRRWVDGEYKPMALERQDESRGELAVTFERAEENGNGTAEEGEEEESS